MKMMKWVILSCGFAAFFSLTAAAPSNGQTNDNPRYDFHGETDKTDIFAIPLDNSQEEQEEELNSFENYSKEHQKK